MTININRRSTGSRDLLNMCHKPIKCWISQFRRWVYLASCFRAAKTRKEQQTSHHPSCSCPVLSGCSGLAPITLPREQAVHSSTSVFPFHHLWQAGLLGFPWDLQQSPGSSPLGNAFARRLASACRPPGFVSLAKNNNSLE